MAETNTSSPQTGSSNDIPSGYAKISMADALLMMGAMGCNHGEKKCSTDTLTPKELRAELVNYYVYQARKALVGVFPKKVAQFTILKEDEPLLKEVEEKLVKDGYHIEQKSGDEAEEIVLIITWKI